MFSSFFAFVVWSVNPEIFSLSVGGFAIAPRWYGLLFALGFVFGQIIMAYIFQKEGKSQRDLEVLTISMIIATVIGARLGHVLFYEPKEFLSDPIRIFKIWEGGLASHGAAIAILYALWRYSRKRPDQSFFWIVDRIVIVVALGGALIRTGNLMNSEIYGKPVTSSVGFIYALPEGLEDNFTKSAKSYQQSQDPTIQLNVSGKKALKDVKAIQEANQLTEVEGKKYIPFHYELIFDPSKTDTAKVLQQARAIFWEMEQYGSFNSNVTLKKDAPKVLSANNKEIVVQVSALGIPRHPTQIYEALFCIILLGITFWMWSAKRQVLPDGVISGTFIILLFSFRFLVEFLKKEQVDFENELPINMGQILSIPIVLAGFGILYLAYKGKGQSVKTPSSSVASSTDQSKEKLLKKS